MNGYVVRFYLEGNCTVDTPCESWMDALDITVRGRRFGVMRDHLRRNVLRVLIVCPGGEVIPFGD